MAENNYPSHDWLKASEPIGGLFAVGNMQGDFFSNTYPVTLPGTSHLLPNCRRFC